MPYSKNNFFLEKFLHLKKRLEDIQIDLENLYRDYDSYTEIRLDETMTKFNCLFSQVTLYIEEIKKKSEGFFPRNNYKKNSAESLKIFKEDIDQLELDVKNFQPNLGVIGATSFN